MFLVSVENIDAIIMALVIACLLALIIFVCYITAKKCKAIVCLLATMGTIIVGGFGTFYIANKIINPNFSLIGITKAKPTITSHESLPNYIEFTIYANDNYSKVVIELNLADENQSTFKTTTLTGTNYVKDHEYSLKYSLSISEMLTTRYYNYELLSYN